MRGHFVPIGARVFINGKNYECTAIKQRESGHYDCKGCDLFGDGFTGCVTVVCTGDCRNDCQWVVFKEVKQ